MDKEKKWTIGILAASAVVIGGYFYTSVKGVPWKRDSIAKELQKYVENKYNIKTKIKDTFYDFKDGHFGVRLCEKAKKGLEFSVETDGERMIDFYPEKLWEWQLENELNPIVKQHITGMKSYQATVVYGMGYEQDGIIPHYKTVKEGIGYVVHLQQKWSPETEEKVINELFHVTKMMKEKEMKHIEFVVYFRESEKDTSIKRIQVLPENVEHIRNREDILQYVEEINIHIEE